jgi:hypothetical protein
MMSVTAWFRRERPQSCKSKYRISAQVSRNVLLYPAMIVKRALFLALLVLAFSRLSDAKKRIYEKGNLIDVSPKYIESPAPQGVALLPPPQILVGYLFEIQPGDFTYFVNAAMCCPLRSQYKLEWTANDPIEFRFDKDRMFVKRPHGKELNARLVKVVHGTASPSLSPPPRSLDPQLPVVLEDAPHGRTLPLDMDFLRADDMCLTLFGNVDAGGFFDHLHGRKTAHGVQFRNGTQEVKTFPGHLIVRLFAVLGTCSAKARAAQPVNAKNLHLDEDFMRSVRFDGSWKQGLAEQVAELGPVAEGRTRNPIPETNNDEWWEYEFRIRSEGISLTDALVIILQSPDGEMVSRFSARLPAKW